MVLLKSYFSPREDGTVLSALEHCELLGWTGFAKMRPQICSCFKPLDQRKATRLAALRKMGRGLYPALSFVFVLASLR
ncbi:unnamed protein product [Sphagnum balticum]